MFYKKTINVAICLAISIIAGCGNNDSQKNEESATSLLGSSIVDGYKGFKFGMDSSQILKLPECGNKYQKEVDATKESLLIDEPKLLQLKEHLNSERQARDEAVKAGEQQNIEVESRLASLKEDEVRVRELLDKAPDSSAESHQLQRDLNDIKKQLFEENSKVFRTKNVTFENLQDEIDQLEKKVAFEKKNVAFSQESAEQWFKDGNTCQIQIFNEPAILHPQFEASKLASVQIELGGFNNDKFQAISKSLSDKYSVSHTYTDEQAESFNQLQSPKISVTFSSGQVSLVAVNTKKINFAGRIDFDNAYTTDDRVMILQYFDVKHAAVAENEATKGEVTGNDL
jgi:hypothetical protein